MSFQKFQEYYNDRMKFYKEYHHEKLLKKAYIKLRKGSEIRFQDIDPEDQQHSVILSDLLIDVPQIKIVKERIYQSLETVQTTKEVDVCIVYGDYGHGKSQTANIILEDILASDREKTSVHLESISTFRNFIINFGKQIKNENSNESNSDEIMNQINIFENAKNTEQISISNLIQSFVSYIKLKSEKDFVNIIILDELDKIITDELERKNWIDFFVTINDQSDLSLLLICLIPQRMAGQLINTDRRLERWNHFFNINATILDGKYSSEVEKAIASILALNNHYYGIEFNERTIQFVYSIIEYKLEYLKSTSIRNVNTWVLILGELLIQFEKFKMWENFDKYLSRKKEDQISIIKSKLIHLFNEDNLPQFELHRDDSEETELYRIEFSIDKLNVSNYKSDGFFQIYVHFMNSEKVVYEVALMVEYFDFDHLIDFEKINSLSDKYPVLSIGIGLDIDNFDELVNKVKEDNASKIQKYPIEFIPIPFNIVAPLLLLPDNQNADNYNQLIQLVINWSNVITGHRDEINYFMRELPTVIIRREILLRSLELAKISPGEIKTSASGGTERTLDKNKAMIFLAANIVSTIDKIEAFKYVNTVEKNVSDTLMAQFPANAIEILKEFWNMLTMLEENELIIKGGNKRYTIKKSDNWDQIKAIELLKSVYETQG